MDFKVGDKFIITDGDKTFWDNSDDNKTIFTVIKVGKVDPNTKWQDAAGKQCVFFRTEKYGRPKDQYFALIDYIKKPTKLEKALL